MISSILHIMYLSGTSVARGGFCKNNLKRISKACPIVLMTSYANPPPQSTTKQAVKNIHSAIIIIIIINTTTRPLCNHHGKTTERNLFALQSIYFLFLSLPCSQGCDQNVTVVLLAQLWLLPYYSGTSLVMAFHF